MASEGSLWEVSFSSLLGEEGQTLCWTIGTKVSVYMELEREDVVEVAPSCEWDVGEQSGKLRVQQQVPQ